jgi:hypothetical protein
MSAPNTARHDDPNPFFDLLAGWRRRFRLRLAGWLRCVFYLAALRLYRPCITEVK